MYSLFFYMLGFPKKKNKLVGKAQSGFYIDFFLKKIADLFIRNIFIYMSLFFGEKYMIEQLTKKTIDLFVFTSNKHIGWTTLNSRLFFYTTLSTIILVLFLINILIFLF